MSIENEYKYLLRAWLPLEAALEKLHPDCGIAHLLGANPDNPVRIRQGYLSPENCLREVVDGRDSNITINYFTFKRRLSNGQNAEIETIIPQPTLKMLWSETTHKLAKRRWSFQEGPVRWDIDFFEDGPNSTYFVMAEAEVPEDVKVAPPLPVFMLKNLAYIIPRSDARFSSRALSDIRAAHKLALEYDAFG